MWAEGEKEASGKQGGNGDGKAKKEKEVRPKNKKGKRKLYVLRKTHNRGRAWLIFWSGLIESVPSSGF